MDFMSIVFLILVLTPAVTIITWLMWQSHCLVTPGTKQYDTFSNTKGTDAK